MTAGSGRWRGSRIATPSTGTWCSYPEGKTVDALVSERAAAQPGATAVVSGSTSITYGELDRRAEAVAGSLRARGVGRGSLVGVSLERGIDLVVTLLGILKSGAAYL